MGINRIVVTDGRIDAVVAFKSDYFPLEAATRREARGSRLRETSTVAADPYLAYNFRVKWDGRYVAAVKTVTGLTGTGAGCP